MRVGQFGFTIGPATKCTAGSHAFTPEMKRVDYARFTKAPDWLPRNEVRTGARAQGHRYEKHVHTTLLERYPEKYVESPWIGYRADGGPRLGFCQPDGLYIDIEKGLIIIVEVKLKHGPKAWEQLNKLYYPCVQHIFKDFEIRLIEVVRWFDPAVFREQYTALCADIHECAPRRANCYNVHILR